MSIIYQSRNFVIEAPDAPLIDRNDGGHIVIEPKVKISDRQQLSPALATELMRLTMVVGEAMTRVMNRNGVDVGRINYQDNGNWSVFSAEGPFMHVHIYGRAKSARIQRYGEACYFPHRRDHPEFYQNNKPLTDEDVHAIQEEIVLLLKEEKYSDRLWSLR